MDRRGTQELENERRYPIALDQHGGLLSLDWFGFCKMKRSEAKKKKEDL